jgi:predicted RNA binding protein YcfA (HicA-like mRNA interferase family)
MYAETSVSDGQEGDSGAQTGFIEERQSGSHMILIHPVTNARTVVPVHKGRTIKEPLRRAIIRDANLTIEQFIELL